ncbi:RES family NAD+ phosphorylase [Halopseudomonas pachastrellae]|uniref:RES family NAD+ phosphorylase n=1 Tax=Halopseudomonas pachastrellae TaxID=254161 RepID=UPI003D7CA343
MVSTKGAAQILTGYRLINSKYPPTSLFDDVADADDFDALFLIQELTNPRLQNELGNLQLINTADIPFGITGCNMATAPFTHVNPAGSRFSSGNYGVLYVADTIETAVLEVRHHQQLYWHNVPALEYERMLFRGLRCTFIDDNLFDLTDRPMSDSVYAPADYSASQAFGAKLRKDGANGVKYWSVRNQAQRALCWGLFTPKIVHSCVQTAAYEMIWSGGITSVGKLSVF